MYNQKLKEKFIATISSEAHRKSMLAAFNAVGKYEENLGKDICTMSNEELLPILTETSGFRTRTRRIRKYLLESYVDWCVREEKVVGACDAIFSVNDLGLEKLKRQMVVDPGHLQTYLDCLYESEDEETIDCVNRCYFWLAFMGFDEERLADIACADVNLQEMVLVFEENEYVIYKESLQAFQKCVELDYFVINHPNYAPVKKRRSDGNQLLRGVRSGVAINNIRATTSRRQGDRSSWRGKYRSNPSINMDLKLSYYRVKLSGLFYRMHEAEMKGMKPDFTAAAEYFMGDYEYKLEKSRNKRGAKVRQVASEYRSDYKRWKEAYSLPSYEQI